MIKEYPKESTEKLSENFSVNEFKCKCNSVTCTTTLVDTDLIDGLQEKRTKWGKPIKIMSGYRCSSHNKAVRGKPGSLHLTGKAADIIVKNMPVKDVADDCEDFDGLGRYSSFTHVDVRGYKARWKG